MIDIRLKKVVSMVALVLTSSLSQAEVNATGVITNTTGLLGLVISEGTPYVGEFDFDGHLTSAVLNISSYCFTTSAVNLPPVSIDCDQSDTTIPILAQGETEYSGDAPSPGTVYDQSGTTFDGVSGLLVTLAYYPELNADLDIDVTFNDDGTGRLVANAGFFGSVTGTFTWY